MAAAYHVIKKEEEKFRNCTFKHMVNSFFDKVRKLCFSAGNIAISDAQIAVFMLCVFIAAWDTEKEKTELQKNGHKRIFA